MKLRLPADLRRQVEEAAQAGGRSLNGEIIRRLEKSFATASDGDETSGVPDFVAAQKMRALEDAMAELKKQVAQLQETYDAYELLDLYDERTGRNMTVLGALFTETED